MKKEYLINLQGNDFVKYEGLLDEAHQHGLSRISTTLIQIPHPDNGSVAIVAAEVETAKGTFTGLGDASPANVNGGDAAFSLRIAEDRAKARALRDAVNVGILATVEVAQPRDDSSAAGRAPTSAARESAEGYNADVPKASPYKQASANQLATIAKLSRLLGQTDEVNEGMTSAEASERITVLSREYNERKGGARRTA